MQRHVRQSLSAWLGIAAIALHILLPWAAQAGASGRPEPDPWQSFCTVHAAAHAVPDAGAGLPAHDDDSGTVHCPFCLFHFAHWAPLPQFALALFETAAVLRWLDPASPLREARVAWTSPPSRAPPSPAAISTP